MLPQVKIGDFGFTKRLACNTASLKVKRITHPRWVAPEVSRLGSVIGGVTVAAAAAAAVSVSAGQVAVSKKFSIMS